MNTIESFKLLRKLSIKYNTRLIETQDKVSLSINNEDLKGIIKGVELFPGLDVLTFDLHLKNSLHLNDLFTKNEAIHFVCCLEGSFIHKQNDKESTEVNRLQNVILSGNKSKPATLVFKSDSVIKMSIITISEYVSDKVVISNRLKLNELFNNLVSQTDVKTSIKHFGAINIEVKNLMYNYLNNDLIGLTNRLLFESAVFKTIAKQFLHYKSSQELSKELNALNQSDRSKILDLSDYISKNLSNNLSVNHLESVSGLNQKKIQQGFKMFFDESVNKFITSLRVLKAKELIETTDLSMSEIVYKIGFSSRSYFSKIFAKRYGLLPTEYKKHHHLTHPTFEYCYYSSVASNIEKKDIEKIIESSIRNNKLLDITGCLVYHDTNFFQIIEGPKQDVLELVKTIKQDKRHTKFNKLYEGIKGGRTFYEWQMALVDSTSPFTNKKHIKFLNQDVAINLMNEKGVKSAHIWEKTRNYLLLNELEKE